MLYYYGMRKKAPKHLRTLEMGEIIAYIGDGKGKTTAAVGVAVRARGYGKKVLFFQFFKSEEWPSGERTSLQLLGVDVRVRGKGFVGILGDKKSKAEHRAQAEAAFLEATRMTLSGAYDVVILDEFISCVEAGILAERHVIALLRQKLKSAKAKKTHVILTGHKKYPRILAHCDLVTDMKMMKHPYYKGYLAVKGIDF